MALQTNEQLLEQLRAIGWTDDNIAVYYPDLIPAYFVVEPEPATTLYERLLTVGWTEERIRAEHPEILPVEEGGIEETIGDPVYTLGERAGEPILPPEPAPEPDSVGDPGGVIIHPVGLGDGGDGTVPDVAADQTADLMLLGLIFL